MHGAFLIAIMPGNTDTVSLHLWVFLQFFSSVFIPLNGSISMQLLAYGILVIGLVYIYAIEH